MASKLKNIAESGNAWWFHSELTYAKTLTDLPPLPTKNLIQWIPFGTQDVAQLEKFYSKYLEMNKDKNFKAKVSEDENKIDELEMGVRFVKVKGDTRQYLKVDLERMRMGPIYWEGEEYFIRRATWFLVPEGAKISEGFPVERGLESLLTDRYNETLQWLNYNQNHTKSLENNNNSNINNNFDDTIVEKIVSLIPEERKEEFNEFRDQSANVSREQNINSSTNISSQTKSPIQIPLIQTHDPQAPDISRYFLVFRQGCTDYARLCVEKKHKGQKEKEKDKETLTKETINKSNSTGHSRAASTSPNFQNHRSYSTNNHHQQSLSIPDIPAALPLESINPISATSTVLSTSLSNTDLHFEMRQSENLHVEYTETYNKYTYTESTTSIKYAYSDSDSHSNNNTSSNNLTTGGYHSFRLYRTYASFYHANGSGGGSSQVKTQRQTVKIDGSGEALKNSFSSNSTNNNASKKKSEYSQGINSNTNNPGLDAALAWKSVRVQNHSFKGHPLPSPEIPCDLNELPGAKYVVFLVHGVGQRAFRKMGFHFNKDCDEMRNVLLDAAQVRGLSPGSVVVLPISWRAELNLAGNFTFGDEFDDRGDFNLFNDDSNYEDMSSRDSSEVSSLNRNDRDNESASVSAKNEVEIDKDLQDLSETLNAKIDPNASTFQKAVSVFEGQFTEILERLALESIPAVRSVLSDATMDILLYVSQKHFKRILGSVLKEVLRMHRLFVNWNPEYQGEFSFAAHSLGSVLVADLLSYTAQPDNFIAKVSENRKNKSTNVDIDDIELFKELAEGNGLPFKVDKFFAMGSPLGIFNLLKHTKPVGCVHSPHINTALQERQRKWKMARKRPGGEEVSDVPAWTVYNCRLFYNVFHPHDPVAHRFESLTMPTRSINPTCSGSGATLQPPLKIPYHKSGLTRFKMDLEAKLARAKDDWSRGIQNMTMKLPTWLGGKSSNTSNGSKQLDDKNIKQDQDNISSNSESVKIRRDDNPLAAFNHHFRRIDFSLQHSVMENPYISALGAHFLYWSDLDIAAFIISELIKN